MSLFTVMKKLVLLASFFVLAPFLLFFSIIFLAFTAYQHDLRLNRTGMTPAKSQVAYAALPEVYEQMQQEIQVKSSREVALQDFFTKYDSPLEPYAALIVATADKYDLDYRLIPAIAMQESSLCKRLPKNSFNCWGYGIYGKKVTRFSGYDEGIEAVSKTLAKYRDDHGLHSPEEIMSRYTPSSNGSWAFGVNHFINQVQ